MVGPLQYPSKTTTAFFPKCDLVYYTYCFSVSPYVPSSCHFNRYSNQLPSIMYVLASFMMTSLHQFLGKQRLVSLPQRNVFKQCCRHSCQLVFKNCSMFECIRII